MLQFNTKDLMKDILDKCKIELLKVAQKAKEAMIYELSIHAGAGYGTTGRSEWNRQVGEAIDFAASNIATEALVRVGIIKKQEDFDIMLKAMLINFGSGHLADTQSNPWIEEYKASAMFNKNRSDFKILSRPNQMLYDMQTGQWRMSTAQSEYEIPQFSQPPTHFFENGIRMIVSDFNEIIDTIINKIDFCSYLCYTKEKGK